MFSIYNLKFSHKFMILGAVIFAQVLALGYTLVREKTRDIEFAEQEIVGVRYLAPLHQLLRHTAEHRGMMNALLNGDRGFADRVAAKGEEIARDLASVDAAEAEYGQRLGTGDAWEKIKGDWAKLGRRAAKLQPPESFQRHTALIQAILELSDRVGDASKLNMDPELTSSYLNELVVMRLPGLAEEIGALRGKSSGVAARRYFEGRDHSDLTARLDRMRDQTEAAQRILTVKLGGAADLQARFAGLLKDLLAAAGAFGALVEQRILGVQNDLMNVAASEVFDSGTTAIVAAYKLYDAVAAAQLAVLEEHRAGAVRDRYVTIATILLLMLVAAFARWAIARSILRPIEQAALLAQAIAKGDLTSTVKVRGRDEGAWLLHELKTMQKKLVEVTAEVRRSATTVYRGTQDIAAGNNDLSSRTEQQAASLEETAASMEELTGTVQRNADNAREADKLAANARTQAEGGGTVVEAAVGGMAEINTAATRIADIIVVIEDIAFQTNLLALNAAIEAARAGEQGRGFGVVASEVRNLAQRSDRAAKEIKELIEDSASKVEEGSRLVSQSGAALREILTSVRKASDTIGEIAAASDEQSAGIAQVSRAVVQMDQVTQQNAALVEEAAAASTSLEEQANHLFKVMEFFKIPSDGEEPVEKRDVKAEPRVERRGSDRPWTKAPEPRPQTEATEIPAGARLKKVAAGNQDPSEQWEEF